MLERNFVNKLLNEATTNIIIPWTKHETVVHLNPPSLWYVLECDILPYDVHGGDLALS